MNQDTPVYTLHCRTRSGNAVALRYAPHTSELLDASGRPLLQDARAASFASVEAVAPTRPGRKSREVHTLKIQLGLGCNYACSYCSQATAAADAPVTRTADADRFLAGLDGWLQGSPRAIEFWGGEPFLYFAKLRRLVPALRRRFPDAVFVVVTNGTLLDAEILDFIERWDLTLAVSHDGPGQHLRGPDPFEDEARAHWLRTLWLRRGRERRRVLFNVVLTPANADIAATARWFAERLGDEQVGLQVEGIVSVYDDRTLHGAGCWSEADYATLHHSIVEGFVHGEALRFQGLRDKARDFIGSLQHRRPSSALGQKCGMDRPDQLAVDLQGRVMTCQNTGAQGRHHLGDVESVEQVRLDTAMHWSHRTGCIHCPVLQLCQGSCMYLQDDHFSRSCENEYRYHLAILAGALQSATGLRLEEITGDIRRPQSRRRIPVLPLAA